MQVGGIVVTGANALVSDVGEPHRAIALNLVNLFFGLGALATPFILANLFARKWFRLCYTMVDPATPDTLAQRLDEQLAATEIGSAVNRMPDGSRQTFVWNARNTDSDRTEGGRKLLHHILAIIEEDPICASWCICSQRCI